MVSVFVQMGKVTHSDASTSAESPRSTASTELHEEVEEICSCNVVVRSTFIDFDDASMARCYRKLRRFVTDSVLVGVLDVPAVYEPGKFSDQQDDEARRRTAKAATQEAQGRVVVEEPTIKPADAGRDAPKQSVPAERTTVMLRNVPNNYTREMLLTLLDEQGLAGCYDFVYLPCDFYRAANLGYAFVNMVDGISVDAVWKALDGFSEWSMATSKVCQVGWSGPHQGFKAHVDRYRNSPVMHKSVPDEYKPVILKDGRRKSFPRPTKKVKAPSGACK
ncbi:unnamed protein product [Effrenium voratum]|uniref:Mei2-like C-terminal RNA recognition motif domain-containing protein n=1 Tax=Effrenium voratum TaxID=2562239 RepID=A0AA36IGZ1_9DINO|nr:unnamed protein product [Effrenium voratum]